MTDKERNQRKGDRRTRKGKSDTHRDRAPADRNEVPTLRHGANNNFPLFKKKISVSALETYKDLGRLFDLNEYYAPDEIDEDDYDLEDDPHELNLGEYKEARKSRLRHMASMKSDRTGLYAYILLHLSNESIDAMKLQNEWALADAGKDPLLLWLLIEATHRVGIVSRIPGVLKSESRNMYQRAVQSAYESIVAYKERFDDLRENYDEHGNPEMEDADVAMDFYRGLDNSRYADFKTNLVNNINSGAIERPANLNEMYSQASAYLVPIKAGHAGTHRTAFATTADKTYKGKRGGGHKDSRGDRETRHDEGEKEATTARNFHEDKDCWGCGVKGHVLRNCPELKTTAGGEDDPDGGSVHMTIMMHTSDDDTDDDTPPDLVSDSSDDEASDDEDSDSDDDYYPTMPDLDSDSSDSDSSDSRLHKLYKHKKVSGKRDAEMYRNVAYLAGPKTTEWYEVLLDNQANTSVIHPKLLQNIRRTAKPVKVGGLSGHTIDVGMIGHLNGFFDVLAFHEGAANILCMADVEDMYDISYEAGQSITIHMDTQDLVFYRRDKIYVGDMREWETYRENNRHVAMVTTVADNERKLTSRELKKVEAARDFIKVAGYPTLKEAIHLVEDGNLLNCRVTASDVRKAFEVDTVNGITPAMAKGKTVNGRPPRLHTDDSIKSEEVKQQLYSDVMHVDDMKFLITVAEPLHLTLTTPVERETTHVLGEALQEHIDTLREKGFDPVRVHCDPQAALAALRGRFPGTEIDVQGAGDHLSVVDNKIRRVKELVRCVNADLPWPLPRERTSALVKYAVTRLNIRRTTAAVGNVAPRVAFTGRKVRVNRELALSFGDYCEVADPKVVGEDQKSRRGTTNRTESCIALYPCSNEVGSWEFLNLATNSTVRRSRWTLMVTPPLVIARMTELATKTTKEPEPLPSQTPDATQPPDETSNRDLTEEEERQPDVQERADGEMTQWECEERELTEEGASDIDSASSTDSEDEGTREDVMQHDTVRDDSDEGEPWEEVKSRRSQRVTRGVSKPKRYSAHVTGIQRPKGASQPVGDEGDPASYHSFHVSARKGLKEYGVTAYHAIMKEFEQLYKAKEAIAPVMPSELTPDEWKGVIRSSLFLNPKHDAMGVFEKVKARLVGNGKQQDRNLWVDRSSPTAMLESIMAVLTIAAKEQREMAGLDIGSAFLEAKWKGESVHIIIEKMLSTMLVNKYPELKAYLREDGTLVMLLKKALYGTLIAGKLWYDKLTSVLRDLGFTANEMDPCVMNKMVEECQLTIVIFVDDILATCASAHALTWLISALKDKFDEVKGGIETDLSYLGMHVKNKTADSKVEVSMEGYEEELIKYSKITGVRKTPATTDLFATGGSSALSPGDLAHFHTMVAKLLYLSLRTRPQICVAVSYLTTRVTCGNEEDMRKLNRVLMYINGTKDNVLTLKCTGPLRVRAYVDVAFGSHEDGKSQTGVTHHIGEATVMAKSQKQKMVSKDSTEGELVGLTDRVDGVLRLDEFMRAQGHKEMNLPEVFQDNLSTITLVTKGGGKYRNVHLRVRQCRLKEKIMNRELIITHMPTGNMIADVLTKPLQGMLFLAMVVLLLNGERSALTGVR